MKNLDSLALIVGTGRCNAKCKHCAGIPLRKWAAKHDGEMDEKLVYDTLLKCYERGARKLAINSSGEPTLSPITMTKTLQMIKGLEPQEIKFDSIHVYSNGIKIGEDEEFCKQYLPIWRDCGLDTIYVTVHNIDNKKNAQVYGVEKYPPLEKSISRIHDAKMQMRANMVLCKDTTYTCNELVESIKYLSSIGADKISAWPVRDMYDNLDLINAPSLDEMKKMQKWILENPKYNARVILEEDRNVYSDGLKLTLFQNGRLSNSWCR
ncbi:MAG: radical SAM protein [Candidatus Woesearchaeota archaeon]